MGPTLYPPRNTAPKVSNTDAKMHACRRVSALAPTDVPNELATSLAPIPKARTNAMIKLRMTAHIYSVCNESMAAAIADVK